MSDANKLSDKDDDWKTMCLLMKREIEELRKDQVRLKENQSQLKADQIINHNMIEQLKNKPNVTNNILQVVCVHPTDNYLDMMTDKLEDFHKALAYIKNCALSLISMKSVN
jgi:hypothetical protein